VVALALFASQRVCRLPETLLGARLELMDPASAASALIAGLSLLLSEIRRRGTHKTGSRLHVALMALESDLSHWYGEAQDVSMNAVSWAARLPASAGTAEEYLRRPIERQTRVIAELRDDFAVTGNRRGTDDTMSVEDLLRIYAPEVLDLAPALVDRQRMLGTGIPAELERRWLVGGQNAVDDYVEQMRRATDGIEEFRRQLAYFIADEFPLRPPSPEK
jgi:hypothetical protein